MFSSSTKAAAPAAAPSTSSSASAAASSVYSMLTSRRSKRSASLCEAVVEFVVAGQSTDPDRTFVERAKNAVWKEKLNAKVVLPSARTTQYIVAPPTPAPVGVKQEKQQQQQQKQREGEGEMSPSPSPTHTAGPRHHQLTTSSETHFWISDDTVSHCYACQAVFSLVRRKHHCRMCGHVFCHECSPYVRGEIVGYYHHNSKITSKKKNKDKHHHVRCCDRCVDAAVRRLTELAAQQELLEAGAASEMVTQDGEVPLTMMGLRESSIRDPSSPRYKHQKGKRADATDVASEKQQHDDTQEEGETFYLSSLRSPAEESCLITLASGQNERERRIKRRGSRTGPLSPSVFGSDDGAVDWTGDAGSMTCTNSEGSDSDVDDDDGNDIHAVQPLPSLDEDAYLELLCPFNLLAPRHVMPKSASSLSTGSYCYNSSLTQQHPWDRRVRRLTRTSTKRTMFHSPPPSSPLNQSNSICNINHQSALSCGSTYVPQVCTIPLDDLQGEVHRVDQGHPMIRAAGAACFRHLRDVFETLLASNRVTLEKESVSQFLDLVWVSAVETHLVHPHFDVTRSVKVICLQQTQQDIDRSSHSLRGSFVLGGIAFRNNVRHKDMKTKIEEPRILLLRGDVAEEPNFHTVPTVLDDYTVASTHRADLLARRICVIQPTVVIAEGNVHHRLVTILKEEGITVITHTRRHLLGRVAFAVSGKIIDSLDRVSIHDFLTGRQAQSSDPTGRCRQFRVTQMLGESLVCLTGVDDQRFSTLILRGYPRDVLKQLKKIFFHTLRCASHMIFEANVFYCFRVGLKHVAVVVPRPNKNTDDDDERCPTSLSLGPCTRYDLPPRRIDIPDFSRAMLEGVGYFDPIEQQALMVQTVTKAPDRDIPTASVRLDSPIRDMAVSASSNDVDPMVTSTATSASRAPAGTEPQTSEQLRFYPYYEESQDISLLAYLWDIMTEAAQGLLLPPKRFFLHNGRRVSVSVERCFEPMGRSIGCWYHCTECSTTSIQREMSASALCTSFGKLLDTWFYASSNNMNSEDDDVVLCTLGCGHDFARSCVWCFGLNLNGFNLVVKMERKDLEMLALAGPRASMKDRTESTESEYEGYFSEEVDNAFALIRDVATFLRNTLDSIETTDFLPSLVVSAQSFRAAIEAKRVVIDATTAEWFQHVKSATSSADLLGVRAEMLAWFRSWDVHVAEIGHIAAKIIEGPSSTSAGRRLPPPSLDLREFSAFANISTSDSQSLSGQPPGGPSSTYSIPPMPASIPTRLMSPTYLLDPSNPVGMVKVDDACSIIAWALCSNEVVALRPVRFVPPCEHGILLRSNALPPGASVSPMMSPSRTQSCTMNEYAASPAISPATTPRSSAVAADPPSPSSTTETVASIADDPIDVLVDKPKTTHRSVSVSRRLDGPRTNHKVDVDVYFPEQFCALHALYTDNNDTHLIMSLLHSVQFKPTGGKSSAAFVMTRDRRFILKQISSFEVKHFTQLAPHYFVYMSQLYQTVRTGARPTSVLTKILGMYTIRVRSKGPNASYTQHLNESRTFILMENLFHNFTPVKSFDLKGSQRNRLQTDASAVQLDGNMVHNVNNGEPLFLRDVDKSWLDKAIACDTELLCAEKIMDYSLLVGIDESQRARVGIIDYIRCYTFDKHVESMVKAHGIIGPAGEPTVVEPRQYKDRFKRWMCKYFCMVPDKASPFRRKVSAEQRRQYQTLLGAATTTTAVDESKKHENNQAEKEVNHVPEENEQVNV